MRFTVQQKSVEVVDREISWGWPLPARANGKLPGSCVLARGSCSGVLSSSLPTVSFAGALLLTWVLDLLSSPLLCHFFLPFFFSLPQEHHDKIKQDLQNDVTHVKLVFVGSASFSAPAAISAILMGFTEQAVPVVHCG